MNKEELFQNTYDAVRNESELVRSFNYDSEAIWDNWKNEYRKVCEESSKMFNQLEEAGLLKEYLEWTCKT